MNISGKAKVIYLLMLSIFLVVAGFFWLDYIGMINLDRMFRKFYHHDAPRVVDAKNDEPSLVEREEFEKEKQKFRERIEDLDKREAHLVEAEKSIDTERDKIEDRKKGIELEARKLENEKKKYSGYVKNVKDLAQKIGTIPPDDAVAIMLKWEDTLVIDVLRQMDANAADEGRQSITSFLISKMKPTERASRIMYLMTQL
jgi:flagellar protein FlbB